MASVRLGLELPATHETYFDHNGDSSSEPISGSIRLTAQTEAELRSLSDVHVSLVLVVSTSTEDEIKQNQQFTNRISRLMSLGSSNAKQRQRSCSILERLTLTLPSSLADARVGYSPEEGIIYKIPFFIPVPANMPPTTVTELGRTSLLIVATATRTDAKIIDTSQELNVVRRMIIGDDPIQHTRTYETSRVIKDVTIRQNFGACTGSKISLSAKISLRKPSSPTNRAMEFKCVAVRGLQWRLEEVTTIFRKPQDTPECEPIQEASYTRELLNGFQRGYWGTAENPMMKTPIQEKDSTIQVPIEIAIRTASPAPEVHLVCYEFDSEPVNSASVFRLGDLSYTTEPKIMTVEHRLRLDLLLSEDCFRAQNKALVDRKPLPAALDASFPIYLVEQAPGNEAMLMPAVPPSYQEIPASPPRYERYEPL